MNRSLNNCRRCSYQSQVHHSLVKYLALFFIFLGPVSGHCDPYAEVDVTLSPAGSFKAKTNEIKGKALLNGGTVTANNITVKLSSLKTGIEMRDKHTKEHLQVEKFPEAILINASGKDGVGEGLLKIKGIEKKVTGTYKIKDNELEAEFPVILSQYEITGIKYMGIGVKDQIKLHVKIPIETEKPKADDKTPEKTKDKKNTTSKDK